MLLQSGLILTEVALDMRITLKNFQVYTISGALAATLTGTYDASPNAGQQPGWHALREVDANGNVDPTIVANIHIIGLTAS